jgi:hypothetical protein
LVDHFFFARPKSGFTFDFKNDRNLDPGYFLNLGVSIKKPLVHSTGQHAADRSFARAHQAHEENIAVVGAGFTGILFTGLHEAILSEAMHAPARKNQ